MPSRPRLARIRSRASRQTADSGGRLRLADGLIDQDSTSPVRADKTYLPDLVLLALGIRIQRRLEFGDAGGWRCNEVDAFIGICVQIKYIPLPIGVANQF